MHEFLENAKRIEEDIIRDRRHLHQNPEIYQDLPMTVAYVLKRLKEIGIEGREICKSGVMAEIGGKKPGKTILLRADMDALPMEEESGLEFASCNHYAHTCGHDMHAAGLLGVARMLKEMEDQIAGTVRLMFQPDEEGLTGAQLMIDAGILDGVDAAFGGHVFPGSLEPGMLAILPGYAMASSDRFKITLKGHGGHGSMPHKAVDPINTAVHIFLGLQEIIAREANAIDPTVITVGSFRAGDAPNIIPETAVMEGSIRAKSKEARALARTRLEEVCKGIAAVYRTGCEVTFTGGTPSLYNNPELLEEMIGYAGEIADEIVTMDFAMGSEDFSLLAERVPAVYIGVGAGGQDEVYQLYYNHNPKVQFSESALVYITAVYSYCAVKWLENHKE